MSIPTLSRLRQRGFSLIELLISVAISLIILAGLSAMLVNVSNTNNEMAKANMQIENGRFAIQALESDVVHAGFWGEFIPQFDDMNWAYVPTDTPTVVPDPCLAYSAANWTRAYKASLLGIGVQAIDGAPGGCVLDSQKASTDALVVRHASTCVAGETGCDAVTAGKLYFQSSLCSAATYGIATTGDGSHITLRAPSVQSNTSVTPGAYVGMTIHTLGGTGAGQTRQITAYDPGNYSVTVSPAWTTAPSSDTSYTIVEDLLATSNFTLHKRGANCGTAASADLRKFTSNIYYIRNYSNVAGDGIPTLVRSSFDPAGAAALSHQTAEALVEGIEIMQVEIGIDNKVRRCGFNLDVDYSVKAAKVDPSTCLLSTDDSKNTLPKNRGDGNADVFKRCTTAAPCTAAELSNAVVAKIYMLVRNTEKTQSYRDTKTYCLMSLPAGGVCPAGSSFGPFNDGFKRHLFSTTVRLTTISGRRETP
jgi:prepilin-type N-terminal cleavage/methylation domain-containing protein